MALKWIQMLKTILISLIVISLGSSMVQAATTCPPCPGTTPAAKTRTPETTRTTLSFRELLAKLPPVPQ
uniref:Uncharacterized protein n=1 Tax=Tetranychus urticae TaxID=32264 RepID=T1JQY8_TETUR